MDGRNLLLLEGLGLGRVSRQVGVRELREFPSGSLALKEFVLGPSVGRVDEFADKRLGLDGDVGGVELDVGVLNGGCGSRDDTCPDREGVLIGDKLCDRAVDGDSECVCGDRWVTDDIERDFDGWIVRKDRRMDEREG